MAFRYFTIDQLVNLDGGRVAEAFKQAVARCVQDCEDRPGEEKSRKVTLQMEMIPVLDESSRCEGVSAEFQVKDSVPTRRSKVYSFGLKHGGDLFFSDENPTNIDQPMLWERDEQGNVRREFADDQEPQAEGEES